MTIHHDKLAYGRLDSLKEDSSEEKLKAMAHRLSENEITEEDGKPENAENAEGGDTPGVKK